MANHKMDIKCAPNCRVIPDEVTAKPGDTVEIHAQGTRADLVFVNKLPVGIQIPSGSKLIMKAMDTGTGKEDVEYPFQVACDKCSTVESELKAAFSSITFNAKIIVDES